MLFCTTTELYICMSGNTYIILYPCIRTLVITNQSYTIYEPSATCSPEIHYSYARVPLPLFYRLFYPCARVNQRTRTTRRRCADMRDRFRLEFFFLFSHSLLARTRSPRGSTTIGPPPTTRRDKHSHFSA